MRIPSATGDDLIEILHNAKPVPEDLLVEAFDLWCQQTTYGKTLLRRAPPVDRKDYSKMLLYRPKAPDRDFTLRYQLSTLPDGNGYTYHAYLLNVPSSGTLFLAKTWVLPGGDRNKGVLKCDVAAPAEVEEFMSALRALSERRLKKTQSAGDVETE